MNIEDMTAEQLMEAAKAKAGAETPASSMRIINIDGMEVQIDTKAIHSSWKVFRLGTQVEEGDFAQNIGTMMEIIENITNVNEAMIVEHCGGDSATIEDVMGVVTKILTEATPKN